MNKVTDESYYDLLIDQALVPYYSGSGNTTHICDCASLLHIPVKEVDMCDLGKQPYHRFPALFTLESTISIEKSGIGDVQRNPYLNFRGQGVIVGIIDTGIDYQHEAFRYSDGSTRIISIWDQSIEEGKAPEKFPFGSEYSREQINVALASNDPFQLVPTKDTNGHGTALASIVGGEENLESGFVGVVPDCDFVIIKLKEAKKNLRKIFSVSEDVLCYQESDIMFGIRYAYETSIQLNRPLVLCIGVGTSQSSHDGRGTLSTYLDNLTRISRNGVAVSGGNEGNKKRHFYEAVKAPSKYGEAELRVDEKDTQFWFEIWPDPLARIAVEIISPVGESTKLVYPQRTGCIEHNYIYSTGTVWINNIILEGKTGNQLILVRVRNMPSGIWRIRLLNVEEVGFSYHIWLPSGNIISEDTYFLNSDPNITITDPGNANDILTVVGYNQETDSILQESSRGYNRIGVVKPNIAAPGYALKCAMPGNVYGTITGSGAATAHTTGILAMVLEWAVVRGNYTSITGYDINNLIIRGARRNPMITYPNNIWGYGEVDAYTLFQRLTV